MNSKYSTAAHSFTAGWEHMHIQSTDGFEARVQGQMTPARPARLNGPKN